MDVSFDALGKDAIEAAPAAWMGVLGQPRPDDRVWLIDADLSATVTTSTDKVIYVDDPAPWLVMAELHTYWDGDLPYDLLRRYALLRHRHRRDVSCVVLLLRREANSSVMTGLFRQRNHLDKDWDFPFTVVRLWELPVETFLTGPLALLPFAPLANVTPEDRDRVKQTIEQRLASEGTRAQKERVVTTLLELLALRYDDEGIQFWRDLMANPDVMKSPLVDYIRNEARTEGRTEGRAEGRAEGVRDIILRIGSTRFGPAPATILSTLDAVTDFDQLHSYLERLFTVQSWQDLLGSGAP